MRILLAVVVAILAVVAAFATYIYKTFPPEPLRRASGPPPLFSFQLQAANGVFIDDAGHLLTTRNAVAGCRALRVAGQGFNAAAAHIQALPSRSDLNLALLQVEAKPAGVASFVDIPDPLPADVSTAEKGPFNVVGFRGVAQDGQDRQQPSFMPVTPVGMVQAPDHSNYLGLQGGLPPAMAGSALIDGKNRIIGVFAGSATTSTPSGTTQIVGGVILSGETLQLARSAGIHPNVIDVSDPASQTHEIVDAATAQVFCFQTGYPIEFYIPKSGQDGRR